MPPFTGESLRKKRNQFFTDLRQRKRVPTSRERRRGRRICARLALVQKDASSLFSPRPEQGAVVARCMQLPARMGTGSRIERPVPRLAVVEKKTQVLAGKFVCERVSFRKTPPKGSNTWLLEVSFISFKKSTNAYRGSSLASTVVKLRCSPRTLRKRLKYLRGKRGMDWLSFPELFGAKRRRAQQFSVAVRGGDPVPRSGRVVRWRCKSCKTWCPSHAPECRFKACRHVHDLKRVD